MWLRNLTIDGLVIFAGGVITGISPTCLGVAIAAHCIAIRGLGA